MNGYPDAQRYLSEDIFEIFLRYFFDFDHNQDLKEY